MAIHTILIFLANLCTFEYKINDKYKVWRWVGWETCLSGNPYQGARLNACCGFSGGLDGAPGGQEDVRLAKIQKGNRNSFAALKHFIAH